MLYRMLMVFIAALALLAVSTSNLSAACIERPYEVAVEPGAALSDFLFDAHLGPVRFEDDSPVLQISEDEIHELERRGVAIEWVHPVVNAPPRAGYHDSASMKTLVESWASTHPDLVRTEIIGESVSGSPLIAVYISANVQDGEAEPAVLFDGSIHGNESIATEVILLFGESLIDGYGSDTAITELLDNAEIVLVPMVNPDGVDAGKRRNDNNVDLNRDHPFFWELGWTGKPTYASQPETQAMVDLSLDHRFVISASYHSGAVLFNYPWDTLPSGPHDAPDVEEIVALASGYADRADMISIEGYDWYQTHGVSEETYYGNNGTLAGIIEISNGQPPPAGQIESIADENIDAMLWYARQSAFGVGGFATDAVTGEPLAAVIWTSRPHWPVYADPVFGDYRRVLAPGIVDVYAAAAGYLDSDEATVHQTEGAYATEDFALAPALAYTGSAYKVIAAQMSDPGDEHNNFSLPFMALGLPDDAPYHMGKGGFVVIDMGERTPIDDVNGADFTVVQAASTSPDEGYSVLAADDWIGPWTAIGNGTGTQTFDLSGAGLSEARYIRINDDNDGDPDAADAGFDLDAVTFDRACDAPDPDFSASPTNGPAPLPVRFTPVMFNLPGCVASLEWDFGDGDTSTEGVVDHTYDKPGMYTVSLKAVGPGGEETVLKTEYIEVTGADDDDADDDLDDDADDDLDDDADDDADDDGADDDAGDDDNDDDNGACCG